MWKGDLWTRLILSVTVRKVWALRRVSNSLVNHGLEIQDTLDQLGSKPGKIPNVTSWDQAQTVWGWGTSWGGLAELFSAPQKAQPFCQALLCHLWFTDTPTLGCDLRLLDSPTMWHFLFLMCLTIQPRNSGQLSRKDLVMHSWPFNSSLCYWCVMIYHIWVLILSIKTAPREWDFCPSLARGHLGVSSQDATVFLYNQDTSADWVPTPVNILLLTQFQRTFFWHWGLGNKGRCAACGLWGVVFTRININTASASSQQGCDKPYQAA